MAEKQDLIMPVPLILGGHTFISQLGNDPPASDAVQRAIVESCLEHGIDWFDTTYQPERIALGSILHELGRRDEAKILAWNFFTDFAAGDPVGVGDYYRAGHIELILEQLQTSYVDCLVVHPLEDPERNARQEELAIEWQRQGYVRKLALWVGDLASGKIARQNEVFDFSICPFNVKSGRHGAAVLKACRGAGLETMATSPFTRGWQLDRMIAVAAAQGQDDPESLRHVLADAMLRYSLFHEGVDRVIVAMRKIDWVKRNVESVARGPLTATERRWLRRLASGPRSGWRRLFTRLLV